MKCVHCGDEIDKSKFPYGADSTCSKCWKTQLGTGPKTHLRIKEMWAYVSIDPKDDNEGVLGFNDGKIMVALVGADPAMMEILRPHAERIARRTNKKVHLVKFTNRVFVEEL